ncbi:MAG: long-chain fatty acid--CoA ligase [Bacillus thermozeamaize]|jgi:long-chain acyl-CoA synthetase|uniref:Long-chain fatty acid--CoA ligase n=1 Tax=Bacillus thermozeamaize TaxID=230954 RepID=A0A1Y3PK69_9BACI|nr:MAG: long-chain fatty acid--CoA ligase [Bacillus thermozeamaize]
MAEKPWLKHYSENVRATLEYPEKTLGDLFIETTEKYPEREAIHFLGKRLTYRQLRDEVFKFANVLSKLGVKKGERVSLMLANTPQSVIAYYAVLLLGGIVVQTNPMYTERELKHQLEDAGVETILALDLVYPRLSKVASQTPLKHIIYTSIKDYLPFPKNLLYPFKQKKDGMWHDIPYGNGVYAYEQLMKAAPATRPEPVALDPKEDLALLQYTGGTTGLPKGVMLTHYNLVVNTFQCMEWQEKHDEEQQRVLAVLPFFHVYGMTVVMNLSIATGALMILLPRFDVKEVLETIQKEKPTQFPGAPTMYIGLLNHPDVNKYDLSSVNICLSGSAPLAPEVQKQFETLSNGGLLVEGYGLTEASPVTHSNPINGLRKVGSIGIPWPDTDARIVDEEGNDVPVGEVGELIIRGPQVMKGYWNRPDETAKTLRDGWLYTGDMARMDEDGYFYIVDRKKDMIIAGGFNIYPREVEDVLFEHPAVKEAAVVGVPDPYRGETVKAFIVLKEGKTVTEEELDQHCRANLAAYKVPRIYEFRDELPKTMVGKVLRRQLQEEERAKYQQQRPQPAEQNAQEG